MEISLTHGEDIRRALSTIRLEIEQIFHTLGEKPKLGDDGFAELIVKLENTTELAIGRFSKRHG